MSKYTQMRETAIYSKQCSVLYRNNPWIEALPDNLDDKGLFHALRSKVEFSEDERAMADYERIEAIQGLSHCFFPLGSSAEIARKVATSIRQGYVNRNPMHQMWSDGLDALHHCVIKKDSSFSNVVGNNANAGGFCIVGDSGMGKTSNVNHILAMFPQLIFH